MANEGNALVEPFDEFVDLEQIDENFTLDEAAEEETVQEGLADEPLFAALLRQVVQQLWRDDPVMQDFVTYVAPLLSDRLGHVTAKGGDFVLTKLEEGADVSRYQHDQSMRAHLINGLFPVLHVASTLQQWDAPQFRYYDDTVRRVFIAGYVLHDWLKLPTVDQELASHGLHHDAVNPAQHRAVVETIFRRWCSDLGLEQFLAPIGGVDLLLHDLLFVACNTQIKWGTLRNLAALPNLHLHGRQRNLAENLSRLADYLAYLGRDPRQVTGSKAIHREISDLSDQSVRLVYHHLADVRGVLTNLIQNAALEVMRNDACVPLLFAPSGVVYLARKDALATPDLIMVAENVVQRVKAIASRRLATNLTGFGRGNIGLKYADYYALFFAPTEMVNVGVKAAFKIIHAGKKPASGKRFAKMVQSAWLEAEVDLDLPDDVRVDQLAEWAFFAEKLARELPDGGSAPKLLIEAMELSDLYQNFLDVPRDTRAGGVGYHWYFAAGHFLKRNAWLDPQQWQERVTQLAQTLQIYLTTAQPAVDSTTAQSDDGFADLRAYVQQILTFGIQPTPTMPSDGLPSGAHHESFAAELLRYQNAKKRGRGTTAMCSLCSSPFTVTKQQEAAILFAPQVYSNKLSLHGSNALRDICSICGLEMMLRQLLMNRSNATGGRFEGRNLRYLYFYPTYFFTPETLEMMRILHTRLRRLSFTELRKELVPETADVVTVNFMPQTWQRLEPLLMTPSAAFNADEDRYMRMQFPENEPITFYFIGVPPPGRDSKDAETWVHPAFLSLLLPLCLDLKVVASESSLPLLNEASELTETVFLDGAHAAIGYIAGKDRLNLDQVWPTLNRLATTYLIHIDGNSSTGGNGFDYRWQNLPALARHLAASPLYAFHYLKKWQRKAKLDTLPPAKAELYLLYHHYLQNGDKDEMTRAQTLTTLYRQFYRTRGSKSHAIVRPLSIVAEALLDADSRLFDSQAALVEAVHGRLYVRIQQLFRENLALKPQGVTPEEREAAITEFARYFVTEIFFNTFRGDLAALRGKQLNLLKNACEVLYRTAEADYWQARKAAGENVEQELEAVLTDA